MKQARLDKILEQHKLWLKTSGEEGEIADLSYADLSYADLSYADLSYADLSHANLNCANLNCADLNCANLNCANLNCADLDYSAFPLWCGGLDVHIDDKQATQLLYHLIRNVQYSKNTTKAMKKVCCIKSLIKQANKFHRVAECGEIKEMAGENNA